MSKRLQISVVERPSVATAGTWWFSTSQSAHLGFGFTRLAIGALLATASVFKGSQLLDGVPLEMTSGLPPWTMWVIAAFEASLAFWLVSGMFKAVASVVTMVTFGSFAAYSLLRIWHGDDSCGCFGQISLSPWVALFVDVAVFAVLAICARPRVRVSCCSGDYTAVSESRRVPGLSRIAMPCLLLIASGGMALLLNELESASALRVASARTVDPEEWVGRRLSVLDECELPSELASGDWMVLVYRSDCEKCRQAVAHMDRSFGEAVSQGPSRAGAALLDVSSGAATFVGVPPEVVYCHMCSSVRFNIRRTPFLLRMKDGVVASCTDVVL